MQARIRNKRAIMVTFATQNFGCNYLIDGKKAAEILKILMIN